jgi:hypothetical protein
MKRQGLRVETFLLIWTLGGCAGGAEAPRVAVRDSAGVRWVSSRAPAWGGEEGWSVGAPMLTIGGEGSELNEVADALILDDGRVVVADGGDSELRFFDPEGRLEATVGGEGDGPGEFRMIQAVGRVAGDTVWVYDFSHRRLTWIGPDAKLLSTRSLTPPLGSGLAVGVLGDGSFVVGESWSSASLPEPLTIGLARGSVAYVRYGRDGMMLDTLALLPGREIVRGQEGGRPTMGSVPFAHAAAHAILGGRLVLGDESDFSLTVWRPDGAPEVIVSWRRGSLELTDSEVGAWIEAEVAARPEAERAAARTRWSEVPVPLLRPAYGRILADSEGYLWVGAYALPGQDATRWDVFDSDGSWLGPVQLPERFRLLRVGSSRVLGVRRDAFDVQRLEVRALSR